MSTRAREFEECFVRIGVVTLTSTRRLSVQMCSATIVISCVVWERVVRGRLKRKVIVLSVAIHGWGQTVNNSHTVIETRVWGKHVSSLLRAVVYFTIHNLSEPEPAFVCSWMERSNVPVTPEWGSTGEIFEIGRHSSDWFESRLRKNESSRRIWWRKLCWMNRMDESNLLLHDIRAMLWSIATDIMSTASAASFVCVASGTPRLPLVTLNSIWIAGVTVCSCICNNKQL